MRIWTALADGLSVLGGHWMLVLGATGVLCLGYSLYSFLLRSLLPENRKSAGSSLLPVFFFAFTVLLRLAFLRDIFVPPYFDSVEHYRLTGQLAAALESHRVIETLRGLTPAYYHLGFHFLASLLTIGLRAESMDVILVLGQVILAAIPVPVYFLVRRETASNGAAFFGMLLAGFGWYMPGYAVNWGKYPALAGLLALEIVLSFAYEIARRKQDGRFPALGLFLILGIVIATLFHTRTLVLICIALASWLIAGRIQAARRPIQYTLLGFMLGGILFLRLYIQTELQIRLALEPYLGLGLGVTLIVLALCPFALLHFRQGFYFSILFILGSFVVLFIPAGLRSPGLESQSLLDRPFVEMTLYFPLSILGGLGLAGLFRSLKRIPSLPGRASLYIKITSILLLFGFTGLLLESYDFYPSECCNFVKYDDTIALDWLDQNLPADAHILVAGTILNVLPTGPSPGLVGTDAGIWIPNLIGRTITFAPFDSDFRSESTLEWLCQMQIGYIYVGSTAQRFNSVQLGGKPAWYEKMLLLPAAQLYQVTGCKK